MDPAALGDGGVVTGGNRATLPSRADGALPVPPGTRIRSQAIPLDQYERAVASAEANLGNPSKRGRISSGTIRLNYQGRGKDFTPVGSIEEAATYYEGVGLAAFQQDGNDAYLLQLTPIAGSSSGVGSGGGPLSIGGLDLFSSTLPSFSFSDLASGFADTLGLSNFFRPSTADEIAGASSGKSPEALFNASQPGTVRSWVLQRRFAENVGSFFSGAFGSGSTFDQYVGAPLDSALNTTLRYTVGPGTPVDSLINQPFYAITGAIANSPLGDPGVIMSLKQSGFGRTAGATLSGIRSLDALRAGSVTGGAALPSVGGRLSNAGGVIRQFTQQSDQVYYRVFSGNNTTGSFLTAVPPRSSAFAREALALPSTNQAAFVQEVLVPAGTPILRSRALPQPAWNRFRGGGEQFELLDRIPARNFGPGRPLP